MTLKGRYILNHDNEVRIGNMVYSHEDLRIMFLDRRNTAEQVAKDLGIGRRRALDILRIAGASRSKFDELPPPRMRVLRFIGKYQKRYKVSPTLSEISEGLEMSVSNVHHHLTNLQKLGYLRWTRKIRSIEILRDISFIVPERPFGQEKRSYCLSKR